MYKVVSKRTVRRIEDTVESEEFRMMKVTLELAKEEDDELWKELIMLHLEELETLHSKDGERMKREFERNLNYDI